MTEVAAIAWELVNEYTSEPFPGAREWASGFDELIFLTHYETHSVVNLVTVGTLDNARTNAPELIEYLTPDGRDIYRQTFLCLTTESAQRTIVDCERDRRNMGSRVHVIEYAQGQDVAERQAAERDPNRYTVTRPADLTRSDDDMRERIDYK